LLAIGLFSWNFSKIAGLAAGWGQPQAQQFRLITKKKAVSLRIRLLQTWLPDRAKFPNFSVELILGLNNAKSRNRWTIIYLRSLTNKGKFAAVLPSIARSIEYSPYLSNLNP